eukprot:3040830-Pleurochrysis_carterae.AAC.1
MPAFSEDRLASSLLLLSWSLTDGSNAPAVSEVRLRGRALCSFKGVRERLQQQMAAGVSVGDCVCLVEEDMRSQWSAV